MYDILSLTTNLLSERPAQLVPAFDRKKGLAVVFKLLNSPNELIRVPALKIFGYFLCRSTLKLVLELQNFVIMCLEKYLLQCSLILRVRNFFNKLSRFWFHFRSILASLMVMKFAGVRMTQWVT